MKRILLPILFLAAAAPAQTTQPATQPALVSISVPISREAPAAYILPAVVKTVDIQLARGWHDGATIRLAVTSISVIRPAKWKTATNVEVSGTAIDILWGTYYTEESIQSLTARLAAAGWGEAAMR